MNNDVWIDSLRIDIVAPLDTKNLVNVTSVYGIAYILTGGQAG